MDKKKVEFVKSSVVCILATGESLIDQCKQFVSLTDNYTETDRNNFTDLYESDEEFKSMVDKMGELSDMIKEVV